MSAQYTQSDTSSHSQTIFLDETPITTQLGTLQPVPSSERFVQWSYGGTDFTHSEQLAKSIRIGVLSWSTGLLQGFTFPAFSLPFSFTVNPIAMYMQNFEFVNGDLVFRIQVNGTRFHQGKLLVYWAPVLPITATFARIQCMPHVELDANKSVNQELRIPYAHLLTMLQIAAGGLNRFGYLTVVVYNQLATDPSSTQALSVTIYAAIENAMLRNPTFTHLVPALEEDDPPHDYADVQADIGETIGSVIGAVKNVVGLLGTLDAPCLDNNQMQRGKWHAYTDSTHGNGPTTSARLNLAQTTIETMPLEALDSTQDEMDLNNVLKIFSYFDTFSWNTAQAADTLLFNFRVYPTEFIKTQPGTLRHPSNLAYIANAFQLWKGSINVRLQIVATEFQKGRLLIAYLPAVGVATTMANALANPQWVLDIQEQRDFSFTIPYYANMPMKHVPLIGAIPNQERNTTGRIQIHVLNTLSSPGQTPNSIEINVLVAAGDDFDLKYPRLPQEFTVRSLDDCDLDEEFADLQSGIDPGNEETRHEDVNTLVATPALSKAPLMFKPMAEDHMDLQAMLRRPMWRSSFTYTPLSTAGNKILSIINKPSGRTDRIDNLLSYFSMLYRFRRGPLRYWISTMTLDSAKNALIVIGQRASNGIETEDNIVPTITAPFLSNFFSYQTNLSIEPNIELTPAYLTNYVKVFANGMDLNANILEAQNNNSGVLDIWVKAQVINVINFEFFHGLADETRFMYYIGPPAITLLI